MAKEEYKLNERQRRFADEYIISGNIEQSAIKAGYSKTYARGNAHKLVANVSIKAYLDERMAEIKSKKIMDQTEIMERLSSIGRQESRDNYYKSEKTIDGVTVVEENKYTTTPNVEEATRAMEMLGKRYVMWTDKVEQTNRNIEIVVGEWDDEDGD